MLATAADIVADPSAPDAFVSWNHGRKIVFGKVEFFVNKAAQTQKRINTLVDQKRLEEKKLKLFGDFLSNL